MKNNKQVLKLGRATKLTLGPSGRFLDGIARPRPSHVK